MIAWERRRALLLGLAGAAATLDVLAFLLLDKVFASFQSGNLLFLGIAAGNGDGALAVRAGTALGCFAIGVGLGAHLLGARMDPDSPGAERRALSIELALLLVLAIVWLAVGTPDTQSVTRLVLLGIAALAMGYQAAMALTFSIPAVMTVAVTATIARLAQLAGLSRAAESAESERPDVFLLIAVPVVYVACATVVALLPDSWWLPILPAGVLAAGVLGDGARARRERHVAPVTARPTA